MSTRKVRVVAAGAAVVTTAVAITAAVLTHAPVASVATTTFTPVADTYANDSSPSTNFVTSGQLGVDASEVKRMFLKFTVSGLTSPVSGATLRIHTDNVSGAESNNGGTFRAMSSTTWSETAVAWNAQPGIDGATLGSLGSVSRNTWYEVNVGALVTGNGTFSTGVTSSSNNGADYDSRESGTTTAPQLIITTGTSPSPSPTIFPAPGDPVLVGAGDIADSGSRDSATAALLDSIPGTVFPAGDNVYPDGTASDFASFYEPTLGAAQGSHASRAGQPRLQHQRRHRLLQLLRCRRRAQPPVRAVRADEPERRPGHGPRHPALRRGHGRRRGVLLRHDPTQQRGAQHRRRGCAQIHLARQRL